MALFRDLSDPNAHGRYLADLLIVGGLQMETLANKGQKVTFQSWSEVVRKATAGWKARPVENQLHWLWEVLTTEPTICREFGAQILYLEDEWKDQEPVTVFNRDQELGVFLKPFRSFGGPVFPIPPGAEPEGVITLLSKLMMSPGKAASRRFECRDVEARVAIRVTSPTLRNRKLS